MPLSYSLGQNLIPSQDAKGKWGYIDESGNVVLNYKFDEAFSFSNGKAKVRKGTKWGYIDSNGVEVIKILYSDMGAWDNGRCKVAVGGSLKDGVLNGAKYGFINESGEILLKPEYDKIGPFQNGYAHIQKSGKYGYIDSDLKIIVPCKYSAVGKFNSQGYCWIAIGGKISNNTITGAAYGVIDKNSNIIIAPKYYHIGTFTDNVLESNTLRSNLMHNQEAIAKGKKMAKDAQKGMAAKSFGASFTNSQQDVIDEMAEKARKANEKFISEIEQTASPEYIRLMKETRDLNLQGYSFIEEKMFSELDMSKSNYFVVSSLLPKSSTESGMLINLLCIDKIGIIDNSGNIILKPKQYNTAFLPSEGLMPVVKSTKKGLTVNYLTQDGELLLKTWPSVVAVSPFENGVAVINGENNQYLIDKSGNKISSSYSLILPQSNGNHIVQSTSGYGIISKDGKEILNPDWNMILPDQNNLYCAQKGVDEKFGFINMDGQFVIQPTFEDARSFADGSGAVKTSKGWGLINTSGKELVPCKWQDIMPVSQHNSIGCWVKDSDKWSFVKLSDQKPVFKGSYHGVTNFDANGVALTYSPDGLYGCIDKQGNQIIPMRLSNIKLINQCLDDMKMENKSSISEIEAHRYNLRNNPSRNGFRLSHTIENAMWEY